MATNVRREAGGEDVERILDRVNGPGDLKSLSHTEKLALATEIREEILQVVAKSGGHLGSGLGAVELTIALHNVFDSPRDKIVWDVGHQTYPHKLITGRRDRFHTIRQTGGLSGFPRRSESEHDAFGVAHASTSLSAGVGYAKARDLRQEDHHVVVVVGDAGLTGGMAFEAMNHAGHDKTNLIVLLNDNSMSIAPNVGALSKYLTRARTEPMYTKLRDDLERLMGSVPGFGPQIVRTAERLKDGLKQVLVPGMLFEELGFTYLGPVDGHDLAAVEEVLRQARRLEGPILIHAHTQKGKGYHLAEGDPVTWHGPGPFKVETGESLRKAGGLPTYSRVFAETLVEMAKTDEGIVAITAAMPDGTGLDLFQAHYPHRFYDVGIAEPHAVTFGAGLACGGMKPFVAIYSTFLQRAYDQIIHDVAIQKLPVRFCLDRAGLVGADGETHQGAFDLAYLRCIPNLVVMAPKDEREFGHMLETARQYEDGPIAVRYPRGAGVGAVPDADLKRIPIGQGELLRSGPDATIVAVGAMVSRAEEAAERLAQQGVSVTVVNARFVKPLDEKLLLETIAQTGVLVTVEEGSLQGGFGSAVLELCADNGLMPTVERLGLPDEFVEHGSVDEFHRQFGLTAPGIKEATLRALKRASGPSATSPAYRTGQERAGAVGG